MDIEAREKMSVWSKLIIVSSHALKSQIVILLILEAILVVVFALVAPYFFTVRNAINIAHQATVVGLLALGQTFVLVSGGIDLSSVANLALSGVMGATVMKTYGIFPGVVTMLAIGVIVGLVNGLSVVKLRMVPFIVTLATMTICTGIALYYTKAITISKLPQSFVNFNNVTVWIIPVPVLIVAAIFLIAYIYLSKGSYGRGLFSVGLNVRTAYLVGLPTARIIMLAYIISGICAGIASILLVSKLASAAAGMVREDLILDNISAAVIGGASIYGGRGNVGGAVLGILFIIIIGNALNLLGISPFTILITKGCIILLAIFVDTMRVKIFGIA